MDYQKEYIEKNPDMHLDDSDLKIRQLCLVIKPSYQIESLLDVACGAGSVTIGLVKKYQPKQAVGLDVSSAMIKKAKELDKDKLVEWIRSDIFTYKHSKKFDLVTCVDILEHIEDDKAFLKRISVLGKYIVVKTPLEDSLFNRFLRKFGIFDPWEDTEKRYGHIHHYNENVLRRMINEGGLKVIESVSVPMPKRSRKIWEFFRLLFYPIALISMDKMVEVSGGFKIYLLTDDKTK